MVEGRCRDRPEIGQVRLEPAAVLSEIFRVNGQGVHGARHCVIGFADHGHGQEQGGRVARKLSGCTVAIGQGMGEAFAVPEDLEQLFHQGRPTDLQFGTTEEAPACSRAQAARALTPQRTLSSRPGCGRCRRRASSFSSIIFKGRSLRARQVDGTLEIAFFRQVIGSGKGRELLVAQDGPDLGDCQT